MERQFIQPTLDQQLESLEQKWFALLKAEFADKSAPHGANGEIQFFSTDFPETSTTSRNEHSQRRQAVGSALCVVCVGINHNLHRARQENNDLTPHIYTRTTGETWTVDLARTRSTRRALNTALAAYAMNRRAWIDNGYAADEFLVPSEWDGREAEYPLVIIKTYLSPFLSTKPWAEYKYFAKKETLNAWDPNRHICDLIQTLGTRGALWVINGNSVWPHFDTASHQMLKWALTPTLSYVSQQNRSIDIFWKTPRPEQRLRLPSFPSC
ncbi:MAG: hypothetical protein WCE87_10600 [Candidatus Udaeobacter sp.]